MTDKQMKICTSCKEGKPDSEFYRDSGSPDGLRSRCKPCERLRNKERYAATKHLRPVKVRKIPMTGAEYSRRYREKYPEKVKAYQIKYDAARRQQKAIKDAERYAKNKEQHAKRYAAWVSANPDSIRVRAANRRARKKLAGGEHTQQDIIDLKRLQKFKCAACKCCIKKVFHVDHITPIAKGGTNDRRNLQLLCEKCNLNKHVKDPIDFMQSKGYLL